MSQVFSFPYFRSLYDTEQACLEEIRKIKYPKGIFCKRCKKTTRHYKLQNRLSYACQFCRTQISPLTGTIFEKTTTPLQLWFLAIYMMTCTRATLSIRDLQKELGVTYKTAWRIFSLLKKLMEQNNGDLLRAPVENNLLRWTFFNRLELKVVEKKELTED